MPSAKPIGVFDSGVGGLSIWREIHRLMPEESTCYLADSKNAPYGNRSRDEIIALSIKNTELLLSMGAKIIVVACNTATTNAISHLRSVFDVPIIGIEPATKPAALNSQSGIIGVLATLGTLSSELFLSTSAMFREEVEIIETVGTGLVQIVETGELEKAKPLLEEYLRPMIEAGADNIVLGCSHYPFLIHLMREIVPSTVRIIDSGAPVARHTQKVLQQLDLLSDNHKHKLEFYTNGSLEILTGFLNRLQITDPFTSKALDF